MKIIGFKAIKEQLEKRVERPISDIELVRAMNDPVILDSIARKVLMGGRRIFKNLCENIDGWTVRLSLDGYYRMYKTLDGRTESIYLGKRLDYKKARRKIEKKEKKLGLLF